MKGFDNFKKAVQKFRIHENSDSHLEARLKCRSLNNPSINEQLSSEAAKVQGIRRAGLLKQLEAMKFLLRQGIALRGHSEEEGNLYQLLTAWSGDCTAIKSWIEERKYMSHDIVNELITLMGHNILRQLLVRIKCVPSWYAVIVDEATDVACREQMNLSIRYVDDDYTIRNEVPAALPVHCLAHSLNLCYRPPSGTEGFDSTFWPLTLHQFLTEEVCALRRALYQAYYFSHNVHSISQ